MTKGEAHKLLVRRLDDLANKDFLLWLDVERVGSAVREEELTRSLDDLLDHLDPDDPDFRICDTQIHVQLPEIEFVLTVQQPRASENRGRKQVVGNTTRTIWMIDGEIIPDF